MLAGFPPQRGSQPAVISPHLRTSSYRKVDPISAGRRADWDAGHQDRRVCLPHTVVQCIEAVIQKVAQMGREKGGAILSGPSRSASMDRSYLTIVNSVAPTMPHHLTAIRLQPDLTRAMRVGGKDLDGAGDLCPEFWDGLVYRK